MAPSASCVGTVRDAYPALAEGDAELERELPALAPRVLELSELLVGRLGIEDVGAAFSGRVTYGSNSWSFAAERSLAYPSGRSSNGRKAG